MAKGMRHSQLSRRRVLQLATVETETSYPNSVAGCETAISDLTKLIESTYA